MVALSRSARGATVRAGGPPGDPVDCCSAMLRSTPPGPAGRAPFLTPDRALRQNRRACLPVPRTNSSLPRKGPALTAVSLVRKGYFPREVPPTFTPAKLASLLRRHPEALPQNGARTQCVRHNLARPGGFRRPLQVPNPHSFVRLADEFEEQWPAIHAHIGANSFSISRPVVTRALERAVRPRFRIGERARLRPKDWRGQRFVLRTDVSQFYSSLYTCTGPGLPDSLGNRVIMPDRARSALIGLGGELLGGVLRASARASRPIGHPFAAASRSSRASRGER